MIHGDWTRMPIKSTRRYVGAAAGVNEPTCKRMYSQEFMVRIQHAQMNQCYTDLISYSDFL